MVRIIILSFFLFSFGLSTEAKSLYSDNNQSIKSDRGFRNMLFGKGLPKNGNRWPFAKGALWMSAATNLKMIVYPEFGKVKGLPYMLTGDYSFNDHFALGFYGGYYAPTYTDAYGSESYQSHLKSYVYGVRLTFHLADIFNRAFLEVVNTRKFDLYATISAGMVSYEWDVSYKYKLHRDFSPANFPSVGAVAGIRYCPVPRFALFAEVGKGSFGYYGFGVALKVMK